MFDFDFGVGTEGGLQVNDRQSQLLAPSVCLTCILLTGWYHFLLCYTLCWAKCREFRKSVLPEAAPCTAGCRPYPNVAVEFWVKRAGDRERALRSTWLKTKQQSLPFLFCCLDISELGVCLLRSSQVPGHPICPTLRPSLWVLVGCLPWILLCLHREPNHLPLV